MYTPFPYVFIRIASLHHRAFNALQLQGTARYLRIREYIRQQLASLRGEVCDDLFHAIAESSDDDLRRQLIRLKRDIYNNKAIAATQFPDLPQALENKLHQYDRYQHKLHTLITDWEGYYDRLVNSHRRHVQQLTGEPLFQKGLLLSSTTLYEQLPFYLNRNPASFRHKELKNEYGVLRYLTRMAFKTSPFSTFTSIGLAEMDVHVDDMHIPAVHTIESNTRLNNQLFGHIRSLLLHHAELNDMLMINLNSTVVHKKDTIQFLVNYNNIESFQTLPATGTIKWILEYFQQHREVSMGELTNCITALIIDSDSAQVKNFVKKLIGVGLLECGMGTSGIHPEWDDHLCQFIETKHIQYPAIRPLYNLLQQLREVRASFNTATSGERYHLLQQSTWLLHDTLAGLQQQAGLKQMSDQEATTQQMAWLKQLQTGHFSMPPFVHRRFSPSFIFYEDSHTNAPVCLPQQLLQHFTGKISELARVCRLLDPLQAERARMCDFFLQHYGQQAEIPVTIFYHDYFFHVKKQSQPPPGQLAARQIPDAIQQQMLQQLTISPYSKEGVISVAISGRSTPVLEEAGSLGMFVQFFKEEEEWKAVINHFLPGMGKLAGRFLHLFPAQVTEQFNEWNNALYPDAELMELSDGSAFNANIHPPLLQRELSMPGSKNNFPESKQVLLKDLCIQYDREKHRLFLWHIQRKKKVYAFDLSLESFYRRSHFYQLLAHFNPESRLLIRPFNNWIDTLIADEHGSQDNAIIHRPRIVFERQVILRRAGWIVPVQLIPVQQQDETDASWFAQLNAWRQASHIPEHVFLYGRSPYMPDQEKKAERPGDDHKPQYIHFGSPLLAGLFKKMIAGYTRVYLEEMLPHLSYLENCRDGRPVTEFLMHGYNFQ